MTKKTFVQFTLSLLALLLVFGCATKEPQELPSFDAPQFDLNRYESNVDNFLIILDASSSMRHPCADGNAKFTIAKAIATRLNQTIPELGQTAGMRSFGHHPSVSRELTERYYGMAPYSTAALAEGLDKLTVPGGTSPLGTALDASHTDFEGLSGVHNALIIISDGKDMPSVVDRAQDLKTRYGSSLCIYTILVGNDPEGETRMKDIASVGACGFFTPAADLMGGAGMAAFVEKVFLKEKAAPAAPAPAPEKARLDSDGDGVYDDEDQCPDTPKGARVNTVGCWVLDNVLFDFDKSVIKQEAYPLLDEVVIILNDNPQMKVELQGHTDNIGTEAYNKGLSDRRAVSVKKYLVKKGIDDARLTTAGFGFSKPVSVNTSPFGRSLNRRVELHPVK